MRVDEQESENKLQKDLIEEANKVIEEFNDEKHEIKSRFKHLMKLMENPDGEESYYKEEDEVDLELCFDKVETEMGKWVHKKDKLIL